MAWKDELGSRKISKNGEQRNGERTHGMLGCIVSCRMSASAPAPEDIAVVAPKDPIAVAVPGPGSLLTCIGIAGLAALAALPPPVFLVAARPGCRWKRYGSSGASSLPSSQSYGVRSNLRSRDAAAAVARRASRG